MDVTQNQRFLFIIFLFFSEDVTAQVSLASFLVRKSPRVEFNSTAHRSRLMSNRAHSVLAAAIRGEARSTYEYRILIHGKQRRDEQIAREFVHEKVV